MTVQSFPLSYYSDQPVHLPLKVSLFTRIHEMQSSLQYLTSVAQKPINEKKRWLADNETLLQHVLEKVTNEDPIQFEEPDMDPEMMKLLMEYTAVLQDMVTVIRSIFHAHTKKSQLKHAQTR